MYYPSQYSPEFTPIVLYLSKLKNDLIKAIIRKSLGMESNYTKTLILKHVKQINKKYWMKIWARILKKKESSWQNWTKVFLNNILLILKLLVLLFQF